MRKFIILILFVAIPLHGVDTPPNKRRALYHGIDPRSVSEHLAFYRLFPDSSEGKRALEDAWGLLSRGQSTGATPLPYDSLPLVEDLIEVVNRPPQEEAIILSEEEMRLIEGLGKSLKNRELRGYACQTEEEVLVLDSDEIDLARALLISQTTDDDQAMEKIRSYEAVFDLMALQVMARLPQHPTAKQVVHALNRFIFEEMRFRFPPHSCYAEDIDLYTFLPSVVDSRRGVCLGVSILYLVLSQRIGVPLEIITPPGHIFVRFEQGDDVINIETTARGVDMPDETYLSMETKALEKRKMKEVVGMAHMNHAAYFWQKEKHEEAVRSYLIALKYMPDDNLIKEFLGYNYLFVGEEKKGRALLEEVRDVVGECYVKNSGIANDYLSGSVDAEGIKAVFKSVDEYRSSILEKKEQIEKILEEYPNFSNGWFHLAITWLQLHRYREGLEALNKFHELDSTNPTAEYYLAALNLERLDLPKAWTHYRIANELVEKKNHRPKALRELKAQLLTTLCE